MVRLEKPIRILTRLREHIRMRILFTLRASLIAMLALSGAFATAARADEGSIHFSVLKAGFVIGGSAGSGSLTFQGRSYPLGIGGISYGFTFGASETRFRGTVSHIRRPSDVNGVYAAGNVGAAVGRGAQAIVLTNQNGAVLTLSGSSVGAIVSADLNGLVLTLK
jgi:lipid-binding SYLF domain-containing protein